MKQIPTPGSSLLICLVLGSQGARAAVQEQSAPFTYNNAGHLISGTGAGQLMDGAVSQGTFTPFNPALGTLTSCTVTFTATAEISGTADALAGMDGSVSATLGGSFFLDGRAFNGTGNGMAPVTAAPGSPLAATLVVDGFSYTFRPENAGQSYDPAILQSLTGSAAFPLEFRPSGNTVTYSNAVDLAVSVNGVLKLTYEYVPAPVVPAITGLVRQTGNGNVTLTWTSAPDSHYAVETSTDLNTWSEVAPDITATGSETSWTETSIPASPGQRFYRVRKTN
jgi:hypothetical protein